MSTILRYKNDLPFDLYHYCLMPNHFHLLIRIVRAADLSKLIHHIATSYSYYVRKAYDKVGYIFQGRYKSFLIENDSYLLDCGRYIERNPVRAGIVRDPAKYDWSSYNFYVNSMPNCLLSVDPLYAELAATPKERQKIYREYIEVPRNYEMLIDSALGFK